MKHYWRLLAAISLILGLTTLIPAPAGKPCLLGYNAHCSFTPFSTVICWIIAGILIWLGRRKSS